MKVLVTGGAGYIGSHACKKLAEQGYLPIVFDNLSTGWADAVKFGPFFHGNIMDKDSLDAVFATYNPDAVMHFAAFSQVGEAMIDPGKYWRNNLCGSLNLVEAAVAANCLDFVFSSTCAVYGEKEGALLNEESTISPLNSYSASKFAVENLIRDFSNSHGLRSVIFRYFNVAGADPDAEIGEAHDPETHLIPIILQAINGERPALTIHGTDYNTLDGTCIRDYIHVMDIVEAHVLGLRYLKLGNATPEIFNLGTGHGFSVREIVRICGEISGQTVSVIEGPRRNGDATSLVSSSQRVNRKLHWTAQRSTLQLMIEDAMRWSLKEQYKK